MDPMIVGKQQQIHTPPRKKSNIYTREYRIGETGVMAASG